MKIFGTPVIFVISKHDKSSLKRHIEAQHEGVRYSCDHCNYKTKQKNHLKYLMMISVVIVNFKWIEML